MTTRPMLAAPDLSVVVRRPQAACPWLADYWALTKPEVNVLIAITTGAAFYLGSSPVRWIPLLHAVLGTILVASGAGTLNQWMEHPFDARMRRTARRAVAAGRVEPFSALLFGTLLSAVGLVYLALAAGSLASALAAATLVSYLWLYTPSKRITPLCTLVGAVPGAMPALIGWAAARGRLDAGAWVLFAIVFLWQFPHVMAIAWMYREDYDRAGYVVLPRGLARPRLVVWQTLLPLVALIPVSLLPLAAGRAHTLDACGAVIAGLGFLYYGARFTRRKTGSSARQLLLASIVYLPALLALMSVLG
jgi:heme o synthase